MLNSLKNIVRLGIVKLVKSTAKTQTLQVQTIGNEVVDNVKHIEPYGFTSCPKENSECLILNLNSFASKPIALLCGGREFRLQELKQGEVALYTDEGDKLVFKRGNIIEATTTTFKINGNTEITGTLKVNGATEMLSTLDVTGDITSTAEIIDKTSNMTTIRTIFDGHIHKLGTVPTTVSETKMGA